MTLIILALANGKFFSDCPGIFMVFYLDVKDINFDTEKLFAYLAASGFFPLDVSTPGDLCT